MFAQARGIGANLVFKSQTAMRQIKVENETQLQVGITSASDPLFGSSFRILDARDLRVGSGLLANCSCS